MKTWEEVCEELKSGDEEVKQMFEIIDVFTNIVSEILKKRFELGYSQRDLARMCKLPQSTIARIECGQVMPKLDTLLKILFPLGLSLTVVSKNC